MLTVDTDGADGATIQINAQCAAALHQLRAYRDRLWCVRVGEGLTDGRISYAIGDSAEAVRAAYRAIYRGDWIVNIWPIVAPIDPRPCAWCARHGRYSH